MTLQCPWPNTGLTWKPNKPWQSIKSEDVLSLCCYADHRKVLTRYISCHITVHWASEGVEVDMSSTLPPAQGSSQSLGILNKRHLSLSPKRKTQSLLSGFCSALHCFPQTLLQRPSEMAKPFKKKLQTLKKPLITWNSSLCFQGLTWTVHQASLVNPLLCDAF